MSYLFIAFGASVIGAISGVGGGVMIKPLLDLFTSMEAGRISLLSSCTVCAMAVASVLRHFFYGTQFHKRTAVWLSMGAVAGGFFGEKIFRLVTANLLSDRLVKQVQNAMLLVLLCLVLVYMNRWSKHIRFQVKHSGAILLSGLMLGLLSAFLGIGGGPVNLVVLTLLFSMDTKEASVNSLVLILFSQASKLVTAAVSSSFAGMSLQPFFFMMLAGVFGGIIGTRLHQGLPGRLVLGIFNMVLIFIMAVSLINLFVS